MVIYDVPHIPDLTKDAARCVESSFRMILKYFLPNKEFNWRKLDKMLQKPKKKGAWWFVIYPQLLKMGFEVREYSSPKLYKGLVKAGVDYLYKWYPKKIAKFYIEESNINDVIKLLPLIIKKKVFYRKIMTLQGVRNLLDNGYLLVADVDFSKIMAKWYGSTHSVAIIGYDKNNIYVNDPAKPKGKATLIKNKDFMKAWPLRELVAIRLKG